MSEEGEIDPDSIKPMSTEQMQGHFQDAIWKLIIRFQNEEFELPDANIIYVFEDTKVRMLEEIDLGSEMLDERPDEEDPEGEAWKV